MVGRRYSCPSSQSFIVTNVDTSDTLFEETVQQQVGKATPVVTKSTGGTSARKSDAATAELSRPVTRSSQKLAVETPPPVASKSGSTSSSKSGSTSRYKPSRKSRVDPASSQQILNPKPASRDLPEAPELESESSESASAPASEPESESDDHDGPMVSEVAGSTANVSAVHDGGAAPDTVIAGSKRVLVSDTARATPNKRPKLNNAVVYEAIDFPPEPVSVIDPLFSRIEFIEIMQVILGLPALILDGGRQGRCVYRGETWLILGATSSHEYTPVHHVSPVAPNKRNLTSLYYPSFTLRE